MATELSVSKWIQEQIVLMSGGTGFLGQALLHKLLKLGCSRIYLLIRPKRNQEAAERLDHILNSEVFQKLNDSSLKTKVIPILFDSSVAGLGITDEDREILLNEVTTVFHGAASVKFDDDLHKAILTNVRVTRDLLILAKDMKNLQVFHYVSTAYSNFQPGVLTQIEEKVYEPKIDRRRLIEAAETVPARIINSLEKKILDRFPNTYTFTKHIAESLVRDFEKYFAVVISRPTVVYPAWKEPSPGWLINMNSPSAICYGIFKGVLRVLYAKGDTKVAYVQVDYVTDITILSTWHKFVKDGSNSVTVCNCQYFHISVNDYKVVYYSEVAVEEKPCRNGLWYPCSFSTPNYYSFFIGHIMLHFLPGLMIDGLLKLSGGAPRLSKVYRKLYMAMTLLRPFQVYEPSFSTVCTQNIINRLPKSDENLFCFEMPNSRDDWNLQYSRDMFDEVKKLMNEPLVPTPADLVHAKRLFYIHVVFTAALTLLTLWYFPYSWLLQMVMSVITMLFDFNKLLSD